MRRRKSSGEPLRAGAYMTLEAVFVIPAAFALVIGLIYLSLILYNRCLLDQDLYLACFRQSVVKEGSGIAAASPPIPEDAAYFLVEGGTTQVEISRSGSWITGRGRASVRAVPSPNVLLKPFAGGESGSGTRAYRLDPAFHIRRFRRLRNLAGRLAEYFKEE